MVCLSEYYSDCSLRSVFTLLVQAGVSCPWINDSQRILLENFDGILNSPSYLYHTVSFCPSSSWLHEYYTAELLQAVKVVGGLPVEWGMCFRKVLLNCEGWALSYWNNTIAVGSGDTNILILDTVTGSQIAVLSGHADAVRSLTFSSDGTSLVSGSIDKTVKLWDVQTGGVVKTFHGHTGWVVSVSISADHTTIASGSDDKTLHLWDIQTGECHQVIEHQNLVDCVSFSPENPQHLISTSGGTAQQWDINGHKVGPTYSGSWIAFSPDGTGQFILHARHKVTVQNINSGIVVANFPITDSAFFLCCFSPDGRLVAVTTKKNAYVWDITGSDPHLVETFVGHTNSITSLVFSSPSTLISTSYDGSVRFWQIGVSSADIAMADPEPIPFTPATAKSIALKAKNDVIIPSDLDGVIKTWGISAGPHKESLQTQVRDSYQTSIQLIGNRLIFAWYTDNEINIWDAKKGKRLQTIYMNRDGVKDLRILGDGFKIFCLYERSIQVWDIWTGKVVDEVEFEHRTHEILQIDGLKVWIRISLIIGYHTRGWDFGIPGPSPLQLSDPLPDKLYLNETKQWEIKTSSMKDTVTGKVVFQIPERFGKATHAQWDGQYLVVSFQPNEALVLDFSQVPSLA